MECFLIKKLLDLVFFDKKNNNNYNNHNHNHNFNGFDTIEINLVLSKVIVFLFLP